MTLDNIIAKEFQIFECAKSFRQEANWLMFMLAEDYNFSIAAPTTFPREIYGHKYKNKGLFRNEWTYYFHGAECRFENLQTGQIVELIYITKPEFGFLDGYFLYHYMTTTNTFKELGNWFVDFSNVWKAIDVLADRGILTRDTSLAQNRNLIAL